LQRLSEFSHPIENNLVDRFLKIYEILDFDSEITSYSGNIQLSNNYKDSKISAYVKK
jgi:hypothetical protein